MMFKPTQQLLARGRLRLTTKQVNGGYYKGNRTGSMGSFDKKGTYRPDATKHRVYIAAEKLDVPGKPVSSEKQKEPFTVSKNCCLFGTHALVNVVGFSNST
jgi:large subunit ribosomal protein L41